MRRNMVWMALAGVLVLGSAGCAKTVSLEVHESLESQYQSLEAQQESIATEKTGLETDKADLKKENSAQAESIAAFQSMELGYQELKNATSDFMKLTAEQRTAAVAAAKTEGMIDELEGRKAELEGEIEGLQQQIEGLQGDIIRVQGEARTYPAGYLNAGSDFETGRYRIYGGSSNFVVHNSLGRLQVNIILGGGRYGVDEYIYNFSSGDQIQASSSFKMVPVE